MKSKLTKTKLFLLDMDGTFYLGERLLNGALELMNYLSDHGLDFLFLTNNSSRSAIEYEKKLRSIGYNVPKGKVFTSGEATTIFMQQYYPGAIVFVVGTKALQNEFERANINLSEQNADVLVLGFDTSITYQKIWKACDLVRKGIPYIATHPDINCPTEEGYMPDTGSFIALIKESTGRLPDFVIGKPNPYIIESVMKKTGFGIQEIAMVGDRLYTDVALGRTGITTILTLSGETKEKELQASSLKPDYVVRDLNELVELLKKEAGDGIRTHEW